MADQVKVNPLKVGMSVLCIKSHGHAIKGDEYIVNMATPDSTFEPCIMVKGCTEVYKSSLFKEVKQKSNDDSEIEVEVHVVEGTGQIPKELKAMLDGLLKAAGVSQGHDPDFKVVADVTELPNKIEEFVQSKFEDDQDCKEFIEELNFMVMHHCWANRNKELSSE